mmetsp:Transcript_3172/g.6182  ORF Transcript_3172/g.6182 Transcript_3172/m.6182 type:complete len:197 (+) Transcript_3172:55-645(+)
MTRFIAQKGWIKDHLSERGHPVGPDWCSQEDSFVSWDHPFENPTAPTAGWSSVEVEVDEEEEIFEMVDVHELYGPKIIDHRVNGDTTGKLNDSYFQNWNIMTSTEKNFALSTAAKINHRYREGISKPQSFQTPALQDGMNRGGRITKSVGKQYEWLWTASQKYHTKIGDEVEAPAPEPEPVLAPEPELAPAPTEGE